MPINPEYEQFAERLHEALLTSPATQADCAGYMINTGGLNLTQAAEWAGLSQAQKDAIPGIKSVADVGILKLEAEIAERAVLIVSLENKRWIL